MAYKDHVTGLTYTTANAFQIVLPAQTYNVLKEAGQVTFMAGNQMTTFGQNEHFAVGDFDQVNFTLDPKAPAWNLNIHPLSPAVIELFTDPAAQNSPIRYWTLIIEEETGEVIANHMLWNGRINTQTVNLGREQQVIAIETITANDLLMRPSEAERLNVAWQQHCFGPNVIGLSNNDSAAKNPYWGSDVKSNPTSNSSTGGFSFGGAAIGGGGSYNGGWLINQQKV